MSTYIDFTETNSSTTYNYYLKDVYAQQIQTYYFQINCSINVGTSTNPKTFVT